MSMILECGSDSVLGKRKETDPCRSQFAEEEEGDAGGEKEGDAGGEKEAKEEATCDEKEGDAGGEKEAEEEATCDEKEGDAGGEKEAEAEATCGEKEGDACEICSEDDHSHHCCPWNVRVPLGTVPSVGADWMVVCKHCGESKFNSDELKTCASCGLNFSIKNVVLKVCSYCMKIGHVSEDCQFYLIEFTDNLDPFNVKEAMNGFVLVIRNKSFRNFCVQDIYLVMYGVYKVLNAITLPKYWWCFHFP